MNILEYAVAKKMFSKGGGGGGESGVPIKVATLPTPTADCVGKVYLNTTDGEYYVGAESLVIWEEYEEDVGDKIYFNTSADIPESIKDVPTVDGIAQVDVFGLFDGYSMGGTMFFCTKLDLAGMGIEGYVYFITPSQDFLIPPFIYIGCEGLTVEQFNEMLGSALGMPPIQAFGWQMDEYVTDTSMGYTKVALNQLPNGQPFAYKEKGCILQKLVKATE